jgi:DNA-binding NarL/FixJ family response regulator
MRVWRRIAATDGINREMTAEPRAASPFDARPSVVFADDDEVMRCLLGLQLQQAFDFTGMAASADEAIDVVCARRPDVAVLDVNMPGGGARRAIDEIRRCSPETAIVILSGDETHQTVVDLLLHGAEAYLRKGIDGATLAKQLTFAIEAHRHRRTVATAEHLDAATAGADPR